MRTIVHLSDIHFGRVDYNLIEPLIALVQEIKPDVTVVSGDLTQRAKSHEFEEAREFLKRLPQPQIVVPGNHDVPLYRVFDRFIQPLDGYKSYITDNMEPFFKDDEVAVLGINTARSLVFKGGRINAAQIAHIKEKMLGLEDSITKIIVTHHPFDLPDTYHERQLLGRAKMAMRTLSECGADILLAGHFHISYAGHTATRYKIDNYSALVIQAGTATSTRGRGEANSFNVVKIEQPYISVQQFVWKPEEKAFGVFKEENFIHTGNGWKVVEKA
ncbi:MAG TPA: metallophosphoesterase family protein [Patescibacteria group bacterium]|nr:metallophosphoesterase family protein [Patescibacteria group bacterium]